MQRKVHAFFRSEFFKLGAGALTGLALAGAVTAVQAADVVRCLAGGKTCRFNMVRNAGLPAACLPYATGQVRVRNIGSTELMRVEVSGLKPNTNYDFFVTQVPKAPFGLAWYQGDIQTDAWGFGEQTFEGRFNQETFIVALPGAVPAPRVHNKNFPDNVFGQTQPVGPMHTFHLGLWFNSPVDAAAAGCPNAVTPFNGEHNAGVQILNTSNFLDTQGPLYFVRP
jgi:hypothetical protein